MTSSTLPVLLLSHPIILFPASRVTISVSKELGQALAALIQESDSQPVVATIPITNVPVEGEKLDINDWGTVARIIRLVRPPALHATQPFLLTLHGLTRIRLTHPLRLSTDTSTVLPYHAVEYPPSESVPKKTLVNAFKAAASRLLERLAQDSGRPAKRDAWGKFATMVEDISDQRAGWLADLLVSSINGEYKDRLGTTISGYSKP